jgi:thymidine phosphorylase
LHDLLHSGAAWVKFQQMVTAQGGNAAALDRITDIHQAPVIHEMRADHSGIVTQMDARAIGQAVLELGAGRARAADHIDYAVGCDQMVKTGSSITFGETLLRIHARTNTAAETAEAMIRQGVRIE